MTVDKDGRLIDPERRTLGTCIDLKKIGLLSGLCCGCRCDKMKDRPKEEPCRANRIFRNPSPFCDEGRGAKGDRILVCCACWEKLKLLPGYGGAGRPNCIPEWAWKELSMGALNNDRGKDG